MELKESAYAAIGSSLVLLILGYLTGGIIFYAAAAAAFIAFDIDYYRIRSATRMIGHDLIVIRNGVPHETAPGAPVKLYYRLIFTGKRSIDISISQPVDGSFKSGRTPGSMRLSPGSHHSFTIRLIPSKCGDFTISPLKVSIETWLFKSSLPVGDPDAIAVRIPLGTPLSRPNLSYFNYGKYSKIIDSVIEKRTGSDFSNVRRYEMGDNIRDIDWAISARTGDIIVREYENERVKPTVFMIDLDPSMAVGKVQSGLDSAVNLTGALIDRMMIDNERNGLACFSRSDIVFYEKLGMGRHHMASLKELLSSVKPVEGSASFRPSYLSINDVRDIGHMVDHAIGSRVLSPIIEETLAEYSANIKDDGFARSILKVSLSSNTSCHIIVMTNLSMGMASLLNGIRLAGYYGHTVSVVFTPHIWFREKELIEIDTYDERYLEISDAIAKLKGRSVKIAELRPADKPENILYGGRIKSRMTGIRG